MALTETTRDRLAYVAGGNYGPVLIMKTIASGAALTAGTILGRVTATGKFKAYDAQASDGTQTAVAVLMEAAAAASADVQAVMGFAGAYVEANMTGLDAAGKLALEARGLYFT